MSSERELERIRKTWFIVLQKMVYCIVHALAFFPKSQSFLFIDVAHKN